MSEQLTMLRATMLALLFVLGITVTTPVAMGFPLARPGSNMISGSATGPALSPVVHAAVLDAPKNSSASVQVKLAKGFLEGIQKQISNLFKSSTSARADKAEKLKTGWKQGKVHGLNASLASSPADLQPQDGGLRGMVNGISSTVEGVRSNIQRALFTDTGEWYKVVVRNRTMVVARVSGKRIGGVERNRITMRPKKVFVDGKTVVVSVDEIGERKETGVYKINIGKYDVWPEDVYLRLGQGRGLESFDIVIPRKKRRNGTDESNAEEEDSEEFLGLQMECQKRHGVSGIRRMVCTCEKMHGEGTSGGVMCVTRIADRMVRIANEVGAGRSGWKVYWGAKNCKRKDGMKARHDCMVEMLERVAGEGSEIGSKHGRDILSSEMEGAGLEFEDEELEDGVSKEMGMVEKVKRVLMYLGFAVGAGLFAVCLYDLRRQYGLYKTHRGRASEVCRLPEHAQTIYSRLISRL